MENEIDILTLALAKKAGGSSGGVSKEYVDGEIMAIQQSVINNSNAIQNAVGDISSLSSDVQETDDTVDSLTNDVRGNNEQIQTLNSKQDRYVTKVSNPNIVYGNNESTVQTALPYSVEPTGNTLVMRTMGGHIEVSEPVLDSDASNKGYVDDRDGVIISRVAKMDVPTLITTEQPTINLASCANQIVFDVQPTLIALTPSNKLRTNVKLLLTTSGSFTSKEELITCPDGVIHWVKGNTEMVADTTYLIDIAIGKEKNIYCNYVVF